MKKTIKDFISKGDKNYNKLVILYEVFTQGLERLDWDDAAVLLASLMSDNLRREYELNNITHKEGKLNKIFRDNPYQSGISAGDHYGEFKKDGKTTIATFEPYGLSMEDVIQMIDFCKKKKLYFEIGGGTFHFPGKTIMVKVTKKNGK